MGRRELDGRRGIAILEDLKPIYSGTRWAIKIRLTIDRGSEDVPPSTDWYLQVDSDYPHGAIDLWPARNGGIATTFPHQNANTEPRETINEQPWRNGRLCVDEADVHLAGERLIGQETTAKGKMLWHCERARLWLAAAVDGTLAVNGDHYEPPHYQTHSVRIRVSYVEDGETLGWWTARSGQVGLLRFHFAGDSALFVSDAIDRQGGQHSTAWGSAVRAEKYSDSGCWMVFPDALTSHQHHAPHTWGEFRLAAQRQGIDLDALLPLVINRARRCPNGFLLCVGHPIPGIIGGPAIEMHFQTLDFPTGGVRKKDSDEVALKWLTRDGPLANGTTIKWLPTYNLAQNHVAVRGELNAVLTTSRIVVLGCGALGAPVAELLVRMGANSVSLIDNESFEPINFPRHLLTLSAIGSRKVLALAERLNVASPFAEVMAVDDAYPYDGSTDAVQSADVIVDCTAEDRVLATSPGDARDRWCFSFSLGANAEKLFAYSSYSNWFDHEGFVAAFSPFLNEMRAILKDFPGRDIGCHNPTFPAPFNRIVAHAGTAIEFMNSSILTRKGDMVAEVFALAKPE